MATQIPYDRLLRVLFVAEPGTPYRVRLITRSPQRFRLKVRKRGHPGHCPESQWWGYHVLDMSVLPYGRVVRSGESARWEDAIKAGLRERNNAEQAEAWGG